MILSQKSWQDLTEKAMNRDQVLKSIAEHREKLASDFGVKSLALFGSVVRDEATPASDVDLLVEFDGRPVGLFHLSRTQRYLESILGVLKVVLVLRDGIKPALRERILREAIHAAWRPGFPDPGHPRSHCRNPALYFQR
jgi:predicted nucleotidyltransferase